MIELPITKTWDNQEIDDQKYKTRAIVSFEEGGVRIKVGAHDLSGKCPEEPSGTRVANLWEFNVVEVFIANEQEEYIEIELGECGHWLVLSFDGIRKRSNEHQNFEPKLTFEKKNGVWLSEILIPNEILPKQPTKINAYAILNNNFLAHHAVGGSEPDFHQPDKFPKITDYAA